MQTSKTSQTIRLGAVLFSLALAAQAGNVFRADNANTLNLPAAWTGGATPTAADVAVWNNTVQVNNTGLLGADTNWAGIQILDPALPVTISAGNKLTLGASGIDLSLATNNLTLANTVSNAVSQAWGVSNGLTLTVSGVVSGPSTSLLTKAGNGTLVMSGVNTYSGGTVVNGGIIQFGTTSAGAGAVTNNNGTTLRLNTATTFVNAFDFEGTVTIDLNNFANNMGIGSPGVISGSGNVTFINQNAAAVRTFTLGGSSSSLANFTGSFSFGTSSGVFRFNDGGGIGNTGSSTALFDLGTGTATFLNRNRNGSVNMGALTGGPNTKITQGSSSTGPTPYTIGGRNVPCEFDGTISDGGTSATGISITKVGSSTLTLTGPNTYISGTTISAGTLQVGNGGTSGALGSGAIVDNASLIFNRSDAFSIANVISGSGNLVQTGPNVLTLTSANTYRGATVVTNGGTIQAAAAGAISPATALTLGGAGTAGTLDLFGNDAQVSALNTGVGATASIVGSSGSANPATFTVNATNGPSTFSGVIQNALPGGSGVVALTVQNGTVFLTGPNTYSGATTISNGALVVAAGGSISASTSLVLATAASTLDVSASGLSLPSGHSLSGVGVVTGAVTAAGSLISPATNGTVGTLSFSNSLALTGGVTLHFDLSASPSFGNDQVLAAGDLNLSGVNTIEISPLTGSMGVGTYKLFSAGSVTGGLPNLNLVGSPGDGLTAALSVTGNEVDLVVSLSGAAFIWQGDGSLNQWDYTTANWRSNGIALLFTDGAFTVFDDSGSSTPAIDITAPVAPAAVVMNSSVNYTLGSVGGTGKLTGISSLTKNNSGTLTLLTPNDYVGGTFLNSGTIRIGNGSVAGATLGNGGVVDNGSLVFNQPDAYDFTNVISGGGNLTQQGASTLTLSGNNTYRGTTTVTGGTLQVGDGNASGSLGTNAVFNNAALVFNRSDNVVQAGAISGSGTLSVLAGTVAVTASNTYSGATTINPGSTLQLGNGGATGSVVLTNVTDNGTLAFNHSVNETNSIVISGSGGISKLAGNVLTLAATNLYNGDTVISAGTLKIGNAATLPSGSGYGNVVLNGGSAVAGTLDMNGLNLTLNGINGNSKSVLGKVVNNFGTVTNVLTVGTGDATTAFSGLIADNTGTGGKIALRKTGTGTFTLSGTNSYTGGTVLSNGVLALGSNGANNLGGSSGVGSTNQPVVFNGGTLQLFGYNGSTGPNYNSFYNPLVVPVGQTGTLQLFPRGAVSGNPGLGSPLTGGGTLNLVVNYVRDSLDGDWSAFTGLINVTGKNASADEFRINNRFGYSKAAIFLNDGVIMDRASGANATNDIGELAGTSGAMVRAGNSSSANPTWRVGWKNTTATFAGTIQNDGTTSIIKVGTGKWILTGANSYTGTTTISNGVLALGDGVTDGSIDNSTNINVSAGAFLDVSGRSDGSLQLNFTQVLSGNGTVRGILNSASGGTVCPGGGIFGGLGTLTVTNTINLGGTAWMKVNRGSTPNSDRLVSSTASIISYGGTLVVTNIGAPLQVGDTFTLFSAAALNSSFTLALPSYYTWNTSQLTVNGQISVTGTSKPAITNVDFSQLPAGSITINANNGAPNGPVTILTSTNLTLPLSSWTTVIATTFDGNGNLSQSITVDPALPQSFYLLQAF